MMLDRAGRCMQIVLFGASLAGAAWAPLLPGPVTLSGCLCRHERGSRLGEQLAGQPILLSHVLGAIGPVSGGVDGYPTCQLAGTYS
jgi:hypothetical protein